MNGGGDTKQTVTVACCLVNGVELRLHKPGHDDGSGVRHQIVSGSVKLQGPSALAAGALNRSLGEAVLNEGVDAAFMADWLKQNERSPLVGERLVYVADEEPDAEGGA